MLAKVLPVILLFFIPPFLGNYVLFLSLIAINLGILTLSWQLMEKDSGWISFGQSIPFGISAYILAINPYLTFLAPVNFLVFLFLSVFGKSLFPFATLITSIATWQASNYLTINGKGGEEGFSVALQLPSEKIYLASATIFIVFLILLEVLSKSKIGLKIKAVRDNEIAAKSIGLDPIKYRMFAFFISSVIASISGILHAITFSHVSPSVFSPFYALFPFVASTISYGKYYTCIFGSFLVVFLTHALTAIFPEAHYILYSVVLMFFAVMKYAKDS